VTLEVEPGVALEASFAPGSRAAAVVAPPHPLYGGRMDSPVVGEVVQAVAVAGAASMAFNWRGVGASTGPPSGEGGAAERDYAAALAFLAEQIDAPRWACGYSFGGATAIRAAAADPGVNRLVLVSPPASMIDAEALRSFEGPIFLAAGERDDLVQPGELEALVSPMPRAHFCALADADHFFVAAGLPQLGSELGLWLESTGGNS